MKIELHAHTSDTSHCGHVCAHDIVKTYAEQTDYDAIVITDHFNDYILERFGIEDDTERVKRYLAGYYRALEAGKKYNIKIFFGIEVCLNKEIYPGCRNDYLIYGATPDFIYQHPYLYQYTLPELYQICEDNHILLIQAHPNREGCQPSNPDYLHGAEVYNGHIGHRNHNDITLPWAIENHLLQTAGSDFHDYNSLASAGIETQYDIANEKELADCIRKQELKILRNK